MVSEFKFSADGTWLVLGTIAVAVIFAFAIRRKTVMTLTFLSVFMAIVLTTTMTVDRQVSYFGGVGRNFKRSDGGWRHRSLTLEMRGGGTRLTYGVTDTIESEWIYGKNYLLHAWRVPSEDHFPTWNRKFSVTPSGFLEEHGFQLCWGTVRRGASESTFDSKYSITCPQWFLLLFCLPAPAIAYKRFQAAKEVRRWAREGRCLACGYDLRAKSPGSNCPECGQIIPPPNTPPTGDLVAKSA